MDPGLIPRASGQRLAQGVGRLMQSLDFAPITEVTPRPGLRVDVMALGPRGEIWVVECKSSRVDFTSDRKWQGYLDWCDRFFWAVPPGFPREILPGAGGLIVADDWGAEIVQMPAEHLMAASRRRALTLRFARMAAFRHSGAAPPG